MTVRAYSVSLDIERYPSGAATACVWVRLRSGSVYKTRVFEWPAGAPTPSQLLDLEGCMLGELHNLILTTCGVQGALPLMGGETPL
jgi:hypothetical protein